MNSSMTREEQERRRELKRERKALDRAVALGQIHSLGVTMLPTRWSHARRARVATVSAKGAYRRTAERIGEIHKQLTEPIQ
jgi:hypothetical protein